jgi:hypothetical protein
MANQAPFNILADVQTLFAAGKWGYVNEKAQIKADELGWDELQMQSFVACLVPEDFRKRFPNCSVHGDSGVIDADGYKARYDETNKCRGYDPKCHCCFYIKLAIDLDEGIQVGAVVSFHLDH